MLSAQTGKESTAAIQMIPIEGAIHDIFEHITTKVMTREHILPGANREFFDDLFEPEGSPNRDARRHTDAAYALMKSALDVCSARMTLGRFHQRWSRLIRWNSQNLDDKFELIRAVEWHYGYLFRERVRTFMNEVLRHVPANSSLFSDLQGEAKTFKRKTDSFFTTRGRHIHNFPMHDPFADQAATLELVYGFLWSQDPPIEPKIRSYVRGRRLIATRKLKEELTEFHLNISAQAETTLAPFVTVLRKLLPGWPYAPDT